MKSRHLSSIFVLLLSATAHATPDLYVRDFSDLTFPPQLTKSEIQFSLERASAEMYGAAFARIGTVADFMHGHVLFRPLDPHHAEPEHQMTDLSWRPDWENFEMRGILFHTQEELSVDYPPARFELDPLNRNWLLWLADDGDKKRGDMARAENFQREGAENPATVHSEELDPRRFGEHVGDFEYSFYFFRFPCSEADSVSGAFGPKTNLIQIQVGNAPVCLALVSFHCRQDYHSKKPECRSSKPLSPYYQPASS